MHVLTGTDDAELPPSALSTHIMTVSLLCMIFWTCSLTPALYRALISFKRKETSEQVSKLECQWSSCIINTHAVLTTLSLVSILVSTTSTPSWAVLLVDPLWFIPAMILWETLIPVSPRLLVFSVAACSYSDVQEKTLQSPTLTHTITAMVTEHMLLYVPTPRNLWQTFRWLNPLLWSTGNHRCPTWKRI